MGEAKLRREAEGPLASEEAVLQAIRGLALKDAVVPATDNVQVLVIRLSELDEARKVLGGLPRACRDYLKELPSLAASAPEAICWELWPSGRQCTHFLSTLDGYRNLFDAFYGMASARGYGVQVTAFPVDGWQVRLQEVAQEHLEGTQQLVGEIAQCAPLKVQRPRQDAVLVTIPEVSGPGPRAGVNALVLRVFDEFAVNKTSLMRNHAAVRLGFDGYDDDPREVWEFEPVRQTLYQLHHYAPWWPWVAGREQFVMWLGALAAEGLTDVTTQFKVGFKISQEALTRLADEFMRGCLDTLTGAKIDLLKEPAASLVARHFSALRETAQQVNERAINLQLGLQQSASLQDRIDLNAGKFD